MEFAQASRRMLDAAITELRDTEVRIIRLNPLDLKENITHPEYIQRLYQDYERWGAIEIRDWDRLLEHVERQKQFEQELIAEREG